MLRYMAFIGVGKETAIKAMRTTSRTTKLSQDVPEVGIGIASVAGGWEAGKECKHHKQRKTWQGSADLDA